MTIRNLDRMLAPRCVAVIGASSRARAVGHLAVTNMREAGFRGPLLLVNPNATEIEGLPCYPDLASLPMDPDLAVIATPPETVAGLIADLAKRRCAGAVVITAGFNAGSRQALLDAARPSLLRIIGPNCLGLVVPGAGVNASFGPVPAREGGIACFTQSGAVAAALMDWGHTHGVGFRYLVSMGDMADVDFGDMLDFAALDPGTKSILMYVESISAARKFMSAARAAARSKPVVVVKAGRHPAASAAARSHTGAMAGSDAVYDAAFRRAGLVRVTGLADLFSAAEILNRAANPGRAERLAILTNGGGFGVLATDAWLDTGGRMAALAQETKARLDAVLPSTWSGANPVDIIGDAGAQRYRDSLAALLADPGIDTILALYCPTGVASADEAASGLIEACAARPGANVIPCWLASIGAADIRARFASAGLPSFDSIEAAIAGCAELAEYARNQRMMLRAPALSVQIEPDLDAARVIVKAAGPGWMDTPDAKRLLAAHRIPTVAFLPAATPEEAGRAAAELGGSVALKIRSSTILHKSDVGGVVLDLSGEDAVRAAATSMLERIEGVEGFTVEAMAQRPGAFELIMGAHTDPTFGPVILFGHGGVGVEQVADTVVALPPLDLELARATIDRTRIARLLHGYRGRPAVDLDALARTLVAVSRLVLEHPEVMELDLNPVLADPNGVVAVDVRVRLDDGARRQRPAIVPYPHGLETSVTLNDGTDVSLRPVRPDDADGVRQLVDAMAPEDAKGRLLGALRAFSGPLRFRLTQIDYDRELALLAFKEGDPVPLGFARVQADPDGVAGEFAVLVRGDALGHGLGTALTGRIIAIARARGLARLVGSVPRDNARMMQLATDFGFVAEETEGEELVMGLAL